LGRALGRGLSYSQARKKLGEPTLEGAFVVGQLARALAGWEREGLVAAEHLPLLRMICQAITEEQPLYIL
jgi:hypothetical protein